MARCPIHGASCRCCSGSVFLQRKPAGCCGEAKWWAATVLPRVLRFKRPLHHSLMLAARNGARGRICTCTGDALNVVSLLLDYELLAQGHQQLEPPAGDAPAGSLYKSKPQAAAWRRIKFRTRRQSVPALRPQEAYRRDFNQDGTGSFSCTVWPLA